MVKVKNNLVGTVWGNFLVLSQAEDYISPKGQHKTKWNCKCLLCGNDDVCITDRVLKLGTKQSCGCLRDLTGRKFERLTVLHKDGKDEQEKTLWECQCDCGNVVSVVHNQLTSKNVQSCGCLHSDRVRERLKKYNKYDLSGDYGIGWTTNTNVEFYFDLEDYDKIKDYCWIEDKSVFGYSALKAREKGTNKKVKMSYIVAGKYYDHIDRNPLNNQKENLRPATSSQNSQNRTLSSANTSGFVGVSWDKESNKWAAYIRINKKHKRLGRFINKEDAIRARLEAEVKYYKDFAPQQHLFEQYGVTLQNDCEEE